MKNLEVNYLGLALKNPIVVSSCGITSKIEHIVDLEKAGAGAVVLKSIFEEQIAGEAYAMHYYTDFASASDYLAEYIRMHRLNEHLDLIRQAKAQCAIPIIASINCVSSGEWTAFAREIEKAGADALELNIFLLPLDKESRTEDIEKEYLATVAKVCETVKIPVSVKIGPNFMNLPHIVQELYYRGAKGVVMFNRFFEPDTDVADMQMRSAGVLSDPSEIRQVLRWLAIASSRVGTVDYAATTGIHDGEAVVKALLAGAKVAQVCSTIYKNGNGVIAEMKEYLSRWMTDHIFVRVEDFVGKMNYRNVANPLAYERTQFMRYFSEREE